MYLKVKVVKVKSKRFNSDKLNVIIDELLDSTSKSKDKALKFYEGAKKKIDDLEEEIKTTKERIVFLNLQIAEKTKESKRLRNELVKTAKEIAENPGASQLEHKNIYEKTEKLLLELESMEEEYKDYFDRNNKLERELLESRESLVDANELIQSIGTSFKYLNDDLSGISNHLGEKETVLFKIIESGEKEKKRLSRDIHDGPAQSLAHLNLEIQMLKGLVNKDDKKSTIEKVNEINQYTKSTLEDMRNIIYDLRPMMLDDLGLIPMLESYVEEFKKRTKMDIHLVVFDNFNLTKDLPTTLNLTIFRIVQEILNNIYKHSGTSEASIKLQISKENIKLAGVDYGKGFNVDEVFENIYINGGFGLLGIKERVELVDGDFDIVSTINEGTKVFVTIPMERKAESI